MMNTWYASDWGQAYRPSYAEIRRTVVRHIQVYLYHLLIGLGPNYCKRANIVVPPGDNIHSYHLTMVTKNYCAPGLIDCALGLKYLDTPV